jgi:antitoxin MazE
MLTRCGFIRKLAPDFYARMQIMEVIIKKWGNSAAVRIPAAIMASAQVNLEQSVDLQVVQGSIIIKPVRQYKLDELLGAITADNLHQLVDSGAPMGKEVW